MSAAWEMSASMRSEMSPLEDSARRIERVGEVRTVPPNRVIVCGGVREPFGLYSGGGETAGS